MPAEDIDDLFRDKLAGHATPPGDALWARLQAAADATPAPDASAERLDQLFKQGLNAHATPPGRELWERLEDEHLRPHKRRAAAWWPMALAAAVALLLVAGGAGLWLGFPSGSTQHGTVASQQNRGAAPAPGNKANKTANSAATAAIINQETASAAKQAEAIGTGKAANNMSPVVKPTTKALQTASTTATHKNITNRATRPAALASTAPKANRAASEPSPRHPMETTRQPDAATEHRPLVARTTVRSAPRTTLNKSLFPAADEQRPTTKTTAQVVILPTPAPTPEIVPGRPMPTPSLASAGEIITVDVRNGGNPVARSTNSVKTAVALAETTEEPRRLGSRLLQQAGHLVRGERMSLAEVTGLPENVTLRATVAGRSLTKSIQL